MPPTDFASAAMVRLLVQGMRDLQLDPGVPPLNPAEARVDLQLKRDLVRSAERQGGLACLPLLGRGLHRLGHEPTHQALASACGARDLFERWQRLERYIHSRHRCVLLSCGGDAAQIRHVAISGGAAPSAAEDLVVAGVLAALLEAIGLQQVRAWVGGAPACPTPDAAAIAAAALQGATATWRFCWDGSAPTSRPAARAEPGALALGADPAWPAATRAAYRRLVADLARPLSLPELAQVLDMSARSLQRRLAAGGLGYARLLAEARCRAGAWRLLHTPDPIAEVGFLSGFADQAHFTRELQQRVGLPPAAYRAAFAGSRR